jgi:hypothetical protein
MDEFELMTLKKQIMQVELTKWMKVGHMDESQDHFDKILYQGSIMQTHPFCWYILFITCYALLRIALSLGQLLFLNSTPILPFKFTSCKSHEILLVS